LFTVPQTVNTV